MIILWSGILYLGIEVLGTRTKKAQMGRPLLANSCEVHSSRRAIGDGYLQ